jgi:Ca2+ transporting ATPase
MTNGMFYNLIDTDNVDFSDYYHKYHVHSRHFTFIFTTFVLMQFFNFFNCRKVYDEFDLHSNLLNNWLYIVIVSSILILQCIIVTYLNVFFKLYKFHGLSPQQWLISALIGFMGIPLSFILRCFSFGLDDSDRAKPDENTLFE